MNNLQSCQRRYDAQTDERERYSANLNECWNCQETHDSDDMVSGYLFGPVCQDCDRKLIKTEETDDETE